MTFSIAKSFSNAKIEKWAKMSFEFSRLNSEKFQIKPYQVKKVSIFAPKIQENIWKISNENIIYFVAKLKKNETFPVTFHPLWI